MSDLNNIVTFIINLPIEEQYSYLKMLQAEMSENEFNNVKNSLSTKGFNVSTKKLEDASPMSNEKLMELVPSVLVNGVKNSDLSDEEKAAVLTELEQTKPQQTQQASSGNRGFGGEDLILSAKWLGAASAALTAGSVALMRDDLSVGALAGSAVGVVGGYFAADYLDTKLAAKSGFVRYLAALSTGAACGAAGNFLGSFTQEKLFSNKENSDINITINSPGESQVLDQLAVVDWY